jgi:hypothetical protein
MDGDRAGAVEGGEAGNQVGHAVLVETGRELRGARLGKRERSRKGTESNPDGGSEWRRFWRL